MMYPHSRIEELRYGMVTSKQYSYRTALDKKSTHQARVTVLGLVGDEQAETFHGGLERAVLQFDSDHYAELKRVFPKSGHFFVNGGYGENLVASGMNEHNMCIGDKVSVGSVILEVTQPRQPCYKLNHRFNEPSISRFSQDHSKTGWFYRVLQEGTISVNDEIKVIDRPYPQWTVAKVQHYLYVETANLKVTRELASLSELGEEVKGVFRHRLETNDVEDWSARLASSIELEMRVVKIIDESPNIKRFSLSRTDLGPLPNYRAGAHISLFLPNGIKRAYSLCDSPKDDVYQIAVQKARDSKGGSQYMHESVRVGDVLTVIEPSNGFDMVRDQHHIFVAAGIGITPFIPMIHEAIEHGEKFELHYCVDDIHDYPFKTELSEYADHVNIYSMKQPLDINALLDHHKRGTHVYSCGSPEFVQLVRDSANHWHSNNVHFENFSHAAHPDDGAFTAIVSHKGTELTIEVSEEQTLLEAIRENGLYVDSQCETGTCGRCKVKYDGEVEHRDTTLSRREREHYMTPCVSRCKRGQLNIQLD